MGLAFDNNGYLYASLQGEHGNALDNTIVKLDSSGNRTTFASGLNMPLSLAFDGSSHFYTIDSSGDSIKKIDMSGNISTFASGLSLNYTFGLACDSSGNLYMTDALDGTIKKFDSSGNMSIFASGLNTPMNLAFGSNNNLYVTDGDSSGEPGSLGIILKFDSSGNRSVFATGLDDVPAGIAIYVPEPASMAILALGGLALLGQKRK
jgi:DNA-binding beta-propeller fold protein YncE